MKKEDLELFQDIGKSATHLGEYWDKVLEAALIEHGHLCPGMPLGFRAGRLALKALDTDREPNWAKAALLETGRHHALGGCFADGVQLATGCTFGKNLIRKLEYGKLAVTIAIKKDGKAVRVSVKPEIVQATLDLEYMDKRKQGTLATDIPYDLILEPFRKIISRPEKEFLVVSDIFTYTFPSKPKPSFNIGKCEICGDIAAENKLRVKDEKTVCLPCSEYGN